MSSESPYSLQSYLLETIEMSADKADLIASHFQSENLSKGDFLLHEGQISRRSYFLSEGFVRCYTIDTNGIEVTTRIFSAPDFLNDYLSFFRKEPSQEYYETITACKMQCIDYNSMQYCFHNIPEFREWGRMMLTLNYVTLHQKMLSMLRESAEHRYLNLLEKHPEIVQHVPLKIIASYLGVTDTSLSRIRKEVISRID